MKRKAWVFVIMVGLIVCCGFQAMAIELNFMTWKPEYVLTLRQEIPKFEAKTGIKVNWEIVSEDVAREKIVLDLASHTGAYDLVLTGNWVLAESVEAGFLAPLDEYIKADPDFDMSVWYPAYMEALMYNGKTWGLPMESFGAAVTYRSDWFKKYGVTVPKTMAELWNAAEKLTRDLNGDGKPDIFGCAARGKAGEEPTIISTGFTWAYGATWFEGGAATKQEIMAAKAKPIVNSPEFMAGYKIYADLLKNFGPPGSSNYTWYERVDSFRSGKVAMTLMTAVDAGLVDHPDYNLRGKVGLALPVMGPRRYIQEAFCMSYGINKDSKNKEAAWKLLRVVTGKAFIQNLADNSVSALPMVSVVESDSFRKMHPYRTEDGKYVIDESTKLIDWRYMPYIPEYAVLCDVLGTTISKIIAGQATTREALDAANKTIYDIMKKAGYYK